MTLCQIPLDLHKKKREIAIYRWGKRKRRLGPKRKVGERARKAELELLDLHIRTIDTTVNLLYRVSK